MPRRHTSLNRGIEREQLERVARLYHRNQDASRALGITGHSFSRLCRQHGIETPYARLRRRLTEGRASDPTTDAETAG